MSTSSRWVLLSGLLAAAAFAQHNRKLQEFTPDEKPKTQKAGIGTFAEAEENTVPTDEPLPWKAISMAALAFGIALPIGVSYYRKSAAEQEAARDANMPQTRRRAQEE